MTIANNQQELKNAQSTFNATVPNDAPIQPAQAFVDFWSRFISLASPISKIDCHGLGITRVETAFLDDWQNHITQDDHPDFDGSNNAIDNVDEILAWYAAYASSPTFNATLDLSGGTNATPSGQGLIDKTTLIAAGWTVMTN